MSTPKFDMKNLKKAVGRCDYNKDEVNSPNILSNNKLFDITHSFAYS